MVDYFYDDKPEMRREGIKPVFLWVPGIVSFVFFLVFLLLKVSEKVENSFMSWGWVFGSLVIVLLVTFGISLVVYLFLSMKSKGVQERRFNSRERCDDLIRREIRRRTGYNLSDFTETGDSVEGVGWFGQGGKDDQDKLYYHLYRIQKGSLRRYFLGLMNMQEDLSDDIIIVQSPLNFVDLNKLILETGNRLCRNPVRVMTKERVFTDEVSGRSRVEKEESPLDVKESEGFVDERGVGR